MYAAAQGASACWMASIWRHRVDMSSGTGANPPAVSVYFAGIEARAPFSGRARASSPSRCLSSIDASWWPPRGPATSMNVSSASGGSSARVSPSPTVGTAAPGPCVRG